MAQVDDEFANQNEVQVGTEIKADEGIIQDRDPLTLDIDDEQFIRVANKLISDSKNFYNKELQLDTRRKQNEKYLFGRQIDDVKLKPYNARFIDNVLYEGEAYLKPIVLSRMPDIVVKPGQDTQQDQDTAKQLSKVVTSDIQSRERKQVLGLAFRHLPVYFVGAIKPYWDPEIGADGDYCFKVVHPENLVLDHRATTLNPDDMQYVAEAIEYSVKEWVMRFPDKEEEFYKELRATGKFNDNNDEKTESGMATKVKGWEIWFTWYDKKGDKFERVEGTAWYYNKLVLKKIKNPYWDWEGEERTFSFDRYVDEEEYRASTASGQEIPGMRQETIFHNHFDNPQKPYIFLGYDQWGKTPLDETSRIEQSIYLQQNVDKRGKQITEMLDRARGKHVFSVDGGLKKEDVEEMDMSNPDEDLLVEGDVDKVHSFIPGEQPSPQMVQSLTDSRERILDKMGVHAPVRGQANDDTTATTTQVAREGDFTRADDLADDTINTAAEKMANWILQFIKLFYTEDHFVRILGDDGGVVFQRVSRDMIQDGMEVTISASGVDKLKAEQRAFDMAKLKLIDPLTFYTDINVSDPKGRTQKLMMFMMSPNDYMAKYVLNLQNASNMATALNGNQQSPQALQDIMQLEQGRIPPTPTQADPAYGATFTAWLHSQQFEQLIAQHPELKQPIIQFAQAVQQLLQSGQGQAAQPPIAQPQQPNPQMTAGPVAAQNPTPGQTSRVPINPPQQGGL